MFSKSLLANPEKLHLEYERTLSRLGYVKLLLCTLSWSWVLYCTNLLTQIGLALGSDSYRPTRRYSLTVMPLSIIRLQVEAYRCYERFPSTDFGFLFPENQILLSERVNLRWLLCSLSLNPRFSILEQQLISGGLSLFQLKQVYD